MKLRNYSIMLALVAGILSACNNKGNDNTGENTTTDTVAAAPSTENNATTTTNNNTNNVSNETTDFMQKAASGGMMEVQVGQLALKNSTNKQVKEMGQMLITDHTKGNDKLKAIAQQQNVTLPDSLMDEHKKIYDKLAPLKGKDFDKAFADAAVDDHQKDIDEFTKAADGMKDTAVLRWINESLPVLRKHLQHAKDLQGALKK